MLLTLSFSLLSPSTTIACHTQVIPTLYPPPPTPPRFAHHIHPLHTHIVKASVALCVYRQQSKAAVALASEHAATMQIRGLARRLASCAGEHLLELPLHLKFCSTYSVVVAILYTGGCTAQSWGGGCSSALLNQKLVRHEGRVQLPPNLVLHCPIYSIGSHKCYRDWSCWEREIDLKVPTFLFGNTPATI